MNEDTTTTQGTYSRVLRDRVMVHTEDVSSAYDGLGALPLPRTECLHSCSLVSALKEHHFLLKSRPAGHLLTGFSR